MLNLFTPAECTNNYANIGVVKAERSWGKMLALSILAGLLIAFGAAVTNTAAHTITNVSVARIICGVLFPFGLGMVMLSGAELFTGNCLIVISICECKTSISKMIRSWIGVYAGNFIGSIILAAGCAYFGQMNYSGGGLAVYTMKVAIGKINLSFGNAVVLGIFCNFLVCFAVMFSLTAKDVPGRILGAYMPVCFFVLCGFEHSIANIYYVPAGIFAASVPRYAELAAAAGVDLSVLTWGGFLMNNLLPVTIGNIIGGLSVGLIMWGGHVKK